MNELEFIRELAAAAAAEAPPEVDADVAGRVLREIRASREPSRLVLWAVASVGSVAAAAAAVVAAWLWLSWQDPLGELFGPVVMVMQ